MKNEVLSVDEGKVCTRCLVLKRAADFSPHRLGRLGRQTRCRSCLRAINKERWQRLPKSVRTAKNAGRGKRWRAALDPKQLAIQRQRDQIAKAHWRQANPSYMRNYMRRRMKEDVVFALKMKIRRRIHMALRSIYLGRSERRHKTIELLGCSYEHLKRHLEAQFQPGMSWGQCFSGAIHLDHIIPCSAFDLSDPEQQRRCFHWTNLQPLWRRDNQIKGANCPESIPL